MRLKSKSRASPCDNGLKRKGNTMKKIILGTVMEMRTAHCNFCGEHKEVCIKSNNPVIYSSQKTEQGIWIEDWKYGFFGKKHIVGEWHFRNFVKDYERKTINIDICADCIEQLAKLLKTKGKI